MSNKKKKETSIIRSSAAEYLTGIAASGKGDVETVYADENIWLTQKMMGVLYNVETHTINYHLKKVFADSELQEDSVIRNFRITAADGKNYRSDDELGQLQRIVSAYPDMAELHAERRIPMTMVDGEEHLGGFLKLRDREILQDAGKVTAEPAKAHAETEKYRITQDRLFESDFDKMAKTLLRQNEGSAE